MIKIPTKELKRFFKNAEPITDSRLMPVYAYIKLECQNKKTTLYKTNGHSFVVCPIEGAEFEKDITILLERQILLGLVSKTKEEFITIIPKEKNIEITDGTSKNLKFQAMEAPYPIIQKKGDEKEFLFTTEMISSIVLAKNHILQPLDKDVRGWMTYIHATEAKEKSYIIGCSGHINYLKSFKEKIPVISLDSETVKTIGQFMATGVNYSRSGNYDYFSSDSVSYGFIKCETKCADINPVIDQFNHKETFIISRAELINFCQLVISINSSSLEPEVTINENGKKSVLLNFSTVDGSKTADEEIPIRKCNYKINPFTFYPKRMITMLESFSFEEIRISDIGNTVLFTCDEDPNYVGAMAKIAHRNG